MTRAETSREDAVKIIHMEKKEGGTNPQHPLKQIPEEFSVWVLLIFLREWRVVMHASKLSTWEAEAAIWLSSRPTWVTHLKKKEVDSEFL